ncbi:alanine:cation symporter family protein [Nocardiopsis exhalans]|uniref:AGCS family alanine or glycine:cation symporter n=2 Tax=Nocardiopsis TaxID=2013 RepID=A0A840WLU7_9ACTN|nr:MULTISPECIES: alanine/glycine:cation symporter family protein [Nocardiopsis]MBB5491078.1 AGCS family alanine or glycine:cation symporter [Nocardiopsis metallicus]USY17654.1 alanine:cation symporter family protein [Nocardiopsis exhalans]
MTVLNDILVALNDFFWTFFLIPLLVILAIYFTVRSGFVQIRLLPEMFRVLRSSPGLAPDGKKEISSFQAFALSAASRVGTGNIVGVTLAIMLGGPGAVFWMWLMAAVLGAASFVESTLAQLYKVRTSSGFRGGPAYYMLYGLERRWMGVLFAIIITVTFSLIFNSVQANSIAGAIGTTVTEFGGPSGFWINAAIGLALVLLTAAVIFGGVRRIATVAQGLVPLMAILYILLGVAVVVLNIEAVPGVFGSIFAHAFGFREVAAGGVGTAILWGLRRGMFSNEAGLGSAPNAGATASVSHPAKQGLVQTLGVYFDTWLICSVTAFIVLLYGTEFDPDVAAIEVAQLALQSSLGTWSIHALTVILFLLAWTSVLGNYYYGESNLQFLDATHQHMTYFRYAVLASVFLGCVAPLAVVWSFADISMGVMATVNLLAIAPLSTIAFRLLADYSRQLRNGLDPQFTLSKMPDLKNVHCWGEAGGPLPDAVDRGEGLAEGDPEPQFTPEVDGAEGRHGPDWDHTAAGASGEHGDEDKGSNRDD